MNADAGTSTALVAPSARRDIVRCGAELVELSERFYRGIFVGGLIFVGLAGVAALALLSLRDSTAGYRTGTVLLTAVLILVTPLAVWRAAVLYQLLRRSLAAQLAAVLLSAALVVYPLRSELWWPSCALLMLVASLVGLRRALGYCLIVLVANLAAHGVAGDLDDTPAVSIIGLWIGYVFWCSAFAVFTDRLAAHVLRLNSPAPSRAEGTAIRVDADVTLASPEVTRKPTSDDRVASESGAPTSDAVLAGGVSTARLTARQLQVVALLADGLRYDEAAACLAITTRQVQRHVSNAIERLGVRNANELVAIAVAERIVPVAV